MNVESPNEATYGIGAVAKLTGITTYTLRMWERRYGAVVAERAPNGRRLYSARHVEKLSLLKALTDRGTAISSIANLSLEALQERAEQLDLLQSPLLPDEIRVAVLGAFLTAMLGDAETGDRIRVVAAGTDLRRFGADVKRLQPDVLILEVAVLDAAAADRIHELERGSAAASTVVVYGFGRSQDVRELAATGVRLIRSPVTPGELVMAVTDAVLNRGPAPGIEAGGPEPAPGEAGALAIEHGPAPVRRYSPEQLSRLGQQETTVDCECPKHMADILNTLGAFEVYSQDCEDRDPEDAALHAYLHAATANARAIMEDALARLIEVEKLQV